MTTAMTPSPFVSNSAAPAALLKLLILDDDRSTREACREVAILLGCRATMTESPEQALWVLESEKIDVVLLGLKVPESARQMLFHRIKKRQPNIEVVIMSTDCRAQAAVDALKSGAFDYLAKPFGLEELKVCLRGVADRLQAKVETYKVGEQINGNGFGGMIGRAPEMERVYRIISRAAQTSHPVLILGESGTGKELAARAIHYSGTLRDKPFIPIDCGSLVPTLIESELFGYVKGAFTGAAQSKPGLLAIAEGGTVFLDEVGELALNLQAKLLRALQEKEVRPIGGTKPVPINIRLVAATNRDLEQAVRNGSFRRDLYFRLNVLRLELPPLRERLQDIPLLAGTILDRISRGCGRRHELSQDALAALLAYEWPGNVRELENCIESCCALNSGPVIQTVDLPRNVTGSREPGDVPAGPQITRIADLEKQAILAAIARLNGDKLMAARLLGIGKTTLYRKLKQYRHLQ